MTEIIIAIITLVVALAVAGAAFRLIRESVETVTVWDYQAGLHFKHGRFVETLDAGKHRFWGSGHTVMLYDCRIAELVVSGQEMITADNVSVKLTAVAQWKIIDALKFHQGAEDARQALHTSVQLALRQVVGGRELDAIMEQKAAFGPAMLTQIREEISDELGIGLLRVDIRDVMLAGELKSVYASVLMARKESQAQLERARGEAAALRTLANAASVFEKHPDLFRLRYLDTLKAAGAGYGNQLIIGVPEELMGAVKMKG